MHKLNKCLFSSQFSLFGVELCPISTVLKPFFAKNAMISSNYLKMSGFSSRNVRYPRYEDADFLQLCPQRKCFSIPMERKSLPFFLGRGRQYPNQWTLITLFHYESSSSPEKTFLMNLDRVQKHIELPNTRHCNLEPS